MAFFHFVPVDATSGRERPDAAAVGDHPFTGGFYAVRPSDGMDKDKMLEVIEGSKRTRKLADGVYVTRSLVWGFPDITHVWEEGGNMHVFSHLVYGRSDLGANKRRIETWLDEMGR
ncbi:MAG: DUF1499 domain-containing protein [Pseudomonadota bacterium]